MTKPDITALINFEPDSFSKLLPVAEAILSACRSMARDNVRMATDLVRMEACLSAFKRRWLGAQVDLSSYFRCRGSLCPSCAFERRFYEAHCIETAFWRSMDRAPTATPVHMDFKSVPYPLANARRCVDDAIAHWRRFSSQKVVRHAFHGYVRTLTLDLDPQNDTARACIRVLALVGSRGFVEDAGGWQALWARASRGVPNPRGRDTTLHANDNGLPLTVQSLARRMSNKGVAPDAFLQRQGEDLRCDPALLRHARASVRRRRLVQYAGSFRLRH